MYASTTNHCFIQSRRYCNCSMDVSYQFMQNTNIEEFMMDIQRICFVYFSPTGTTKNVMKLLGKEFNEEITEYDLTNYKQNDIAVSFSETDFVIFGFPVYSGRVPETMTARLKNVTGSKTPMAIVATYGNREYDDALLEMKTMMETAGFKTIGAAAVVTEHSVVRTIGAGRPNENDRMIIKRYANELHHKIATMLDVNEQKDLKVNGNTPYRRYVHIPMAPKSTSKCNNCKVCCNICPTGAIEYKSKIKTNSNKCIGCMRCVRFCPQHARTIGKMKTWGANIFLKTMCKEDKQPELFL